MGHEMRAVGLKAERRAQEPYGRAYPRALRDQTARNAQLFAQTPRVQGGRAAKGDHRIGRQILAVFHRMNTGGIGHVFIHHFGQAPSGLDCGHAKGLAKGLG